MQNITCNNKKEKFCVPIRKKTQNKVEKMGLIDIYVCFVKKEFCFFGKEFVSVAYTVHFFFSYCYAIIYFLYSS